MGGSWGRAVIQSEPFASQGVDEYRAETSYGLRDVVPIFQRCCNVQTPRIAGDMVPAQSNLERGWIPCSG